MTPTASADAGWLERFGELRSALETARGLPLTYVDVQQRSRALVDLLRDAWRDDPARYEAQWAPYLNGQRLPQLVLHDHEALRALGPWLEPIEQWPLAITLSYGAPRSGSDACGGLLSAPGLRHVASLSVLGLDLRDAGARELAETASLGGLRALSLWRVQLGTLGVGALASSGALAGLRALDLQKNPIGDAGVQAITRGFPSLERLHLCDAGLRDDAALMLVRAAPAWLARLQDLSLSHNDLSDAGAEALAACPHLDHLKTLSLDGNPIGGRGESALRARFGARVILSGGGS